VVQGLLRRADATDDPGVDDLRGDQVGGQ
jgi:hypothetical protein